MNRQPMTAFLYVAATITLLMAACSPALRSDPAATPEDKFQSAQRHIYAAVADLQAYVQANPNGKNAVTARMQIKNLQALNTYASLPVFTTLSVNGGPITSWRILSVDAGSDMTHITFEIKNMSDTDTNWFLAFDKCPLVLVDNLGQYYPAGDVGDLPDGVTTGQDAWNEPTWQLHGGQSITVTVDFPPLQPGATGGKVLYRDHYLALSDPGDYEPASFSLLNKKQVPAD